MTSSAPENTRSCIVTKGQQDVSKEVNSVLLRKLDSHKVAEWLLASEQHQAPISGSSSR